MKKEVGKRNETRIDISHIPFSRYGAYVSVTRDEGKKELLIHNVKRRFEEGPAYSVRFGKEEGEDFVSMAVPEKIEISNGNGKAILYVRDDQTLVLESFGIDVHLNMLSDNGYGVEEGSGIFRMISVDQRTYTTIVVETGKAFLDGPYEKYTTCVSAKNRRKNLHVCCQEEHILMALTMSFTEPRYTKLPIMTEAEREIISKEWESFLAQMPEENSQEEEIEEFGRVTWYNLWSSYVRAEDVYKHDTMLMSKKYMSSVWSWDHCFNALAMARIGKRQAMEQFVAPFVLQSEHGLLPDMWNPHREIVWGVTKPPIHGWCFSKLMDQYDFTDEELREVYVYLEKWTKWWLQYSDTDHDGIPEYPQGCDSGWDNATLFDIGFFVETPDLAAFLILQMRTLARIGEALMNRGAAEADWEEKARYWKTESDHMLQNLYEHSWDGKRFIARISGTHEYESQPTSLLAVMPLVLGDILEEEKREKLVKILQENFLTEYGLATEMPEGKKYEADGYWRGPIWAPTTYLLVDGLRRGGCEPLAKEIAKRYCHMSCKVAKGNYENFDAMTGKGLRAPGYTWSASVYMLLHWEYDN